MGETALKHVLRDALGELHKVDQTVKDALVTGRAYATYLNDMKAIEYCVQNARVLLKVAINEAEKLEMMQP